MDGQEPIWLVEMKALTTKFNTLEAEVKMKDLRQEEAQKVHDESVRQFQMVVADQRTKMEDLSKHLRESEFKQQKQGDSIGKLTVMVEQLEAKAAEAQETNDRDRDTWTVKFDNLQTQLASTESKLNTAEEKLTLMAAKLHTAEEKLHTAEGKVRTAEGQLAAAKDVSRQQAKQMALLRDMAVKLQLKLPPNCLPMGELKATKTDAEFVTSVFGAFCCGAGSLLGSAVDYTEKVALDIANAGEDKRPLMTSAPSSSASSSSPPIKRVAGSGCPNNYITHYCCLFRWYTRSSCVRNCWHVPA